MNGVLKSLHHKIIGRGIYGKAIRKDIKFDRNSFVIEFATNTIFMILLGLASIIAFTESEWRFDWNGFRHSLLSVENIIFTLLLFIIAQIIWLVVIIRKIYQIKVEKRLEKNKEVIRARVIEVMPQYYPYGFNGSRKYTITATYVAKGKTYLFTGKFVEPDIFFVMIFEEIKRKGSLLVDIEILVDPQNFKVYKMQIYDWLAEVMKINEMLFAGNPFEAIVKSRN